MRTKFEPKINYTNTHYYMYMYVCIGIIYEYWIFYLLTVSNGEGDMKGGTKEHRQKHEPSLHVVWDVKICKFLG